MALRHDVPGTTQPVLTTQIEQFLLKALENGEAGATHAVDIALCQGAFHGASDVYFEPLADGLSIRFRIDGILHEVANLPKAFQSKIIARIKVLADLIVYQREHPQDGRIDADKTPCGHAMRVATFPTTNGEKTVIRILGVAMGLLNPEELGLPSEIVKKLRSITSRSQGTLLLTGPSSSGKSTTIYSLLNEIRKHQKTTSHIVTIEDPVEYSFDDIAQSQVNHQTGFTFDKALRSILRQDPEVIMIGEIRDPETAQMAIQSGLTGHLVISTIHSGTAAGVFTRLLDMKLEPYLVASSVTGVMAQRLVRVICKKCRVKYKPAPEMLSQYGLTEEDGPFIRGKGCSECNGIGYRGRTAICELLTVNPDFAELVLSRPTTMSLHSAAVRDYSMIPLTQHGVVKVREGITTLEELRRVLPHQPHI
ncbi:MAG: general secretion pathway protein GspE [Candidatus Hydrogenedentota bacterium]